MELGISVQSAYATDDVRAGAEQMVERARLAHEAGLDALFVGDHHSTPVPYYQNSPMLGRMLAEWGDRTAGALYLLPLWHPLLLAEQVGTLASIARGPFVLQCALGPDDEQFPAMGVSARQRVTRFEESLGLLRRLFAGDVVSHEGAWTLTEARARPTPPEPVAIWIGATAPRAIARAARLGDGWIAAPALPPAFCERQLGVYREACEAAGREVGRCVLRRDVYVGADAEEARRSSEPVVAGGYRGFPEEALLIGSVDQVVERLGRFAEMGYDQVLVRHLVQDHALVCESLGRLAEVRRQLGRA